jgi:Na+/serine symporter
MVLIYSHKNNQSIFYYSLVYFGLLKKRLSRKNQYNLLFQFFRESSFFAFYFIYLFSFENE